MVAVSCLAGAFAIAGGPFSIDDGWKFHRGSWSGEAALPAQIVADNIEKLERRFAVS